MSGDTGKDFEKKNVLQGLIIGLRTLNGLLPLCLRITKRCWRLRWRVLINLQVMLICKRNN